ncbi:hypothetical protein PGB90_004894 [Kerria lacca]
MNHKQICTFITFHLCFTLAIICGVYGQRIVTIQLDGTQYYVSKMNPYASELNYFLAYQYCRSIGLQLVSFETKEKADSIAEYLKNAGYSQHDFWTSGNHLGSNMLLWMSTGLPFNATFNYMKKQEGDEPTVPSGPLPMGRRKRGNGIGNTGCIALKAHSLDWDTEDCTKLKDFICEQTRCYFYNYGSIPVSSAQG